MSTRNNSLKEINIATVKKHLVRTFALIAVSTSLIVFVTFSLYLMAEEDKQIVSHLTSFEDIAKKHYLLQKSNVIRVSPSITAYYRAVTLPPRVKEGLPYPSGEVTKVRSYSRDGFMVYFSTFTIDGEENQLYLVINARALEFGDGNWGGMMAISTLLMLFLAGVLNISIKRMFDSLMAPVFTLTHQLNNGDNSDFSVPEHCVEELSQLAKHLNNYAQMKERVVKQEMMFAMYASHELKTPIAIISGAANLQAMKEEDLPFQAKQRQRIIDAANKMQSTVEVLLNIVKQENTITSDSRWTVNELDVGIADLSSKPAPGVKVSLIVEPGTTLNFPPAVLRLILKNLIDNSARFTGHGSINTYISTNKISVQDSGAGLSCTNETEHGLGLMIVKRLCEVYCWSFSLRENTDSDGCKATLKRKSTLRDL